MERICNPRSFWAEKWLGYAVSGLPRLAACQESCQSPRAQPNAPSLRPSARRLPVGDARSRHPHRGPAPAYARRSDQGAWPGTARCSTIRVHELPPLPRHGCGLRLRFPLRDPTRHASRVRGDTEWLRAVDEGCGAPAVSLRRRPRRAMPCSSISPGAASAPRAWERRRQNGTAADAPAGLRAVGVVLWTKSSTAALHGKQRFRHSGSGSGVVQPGWRQGASNDVAVLDGRSRRDRLPY